jgi:hypothetical protein
MSILGPSSLAGIANASSVAGSISRNPALIDRAQVEQAEQQLLADDARLANRDLDDSIETEISHGQVGDRDPDGRLPWQFAEGQPQPEADDPQPAPPQHAPDAEEQLGRRLDLDA